MPTTPQAMEEPKAGSSKGSQAPTQELGTGAKARTPPPQLPTAAELSSDEMGTLEPRSTDSTNSTPHPAARGVKPQSGRSSGSSDPSALIPPSYCPGMFLLLVVLLTIVLSSAFLLLLITTSSPPQPPAFPSGSSIRPFNLN